MLVDPKMLVGNRTYCRETRRLFWIQETELTGEDQETGALIGRGTRFDGPHMPCTHVMWFFMLGRYPGPEMEIDHRDGNVVNSRCAAHTVPSSHR